MTHTLELSGLDGGNPLGFLAALGTLAEISTMVDPPRMSWSNSGGTWNPTLHVTSSIEPQHLVKHLAQRLKLGAPPMSEEQEKKLDASDSAQMAAKKLVKEAQDDIKKRKLRGKERDAATQAEVDPLIAEWNQKRTAWLQILEQVSPSPELALGKDPAATPTHFRFTAERIRNRLEENGRDRACADLIASFGCDVIFDEKSNRITPTPFCFVTGSGHQYFLKTVGDLLGNVDEPRLQRALFEPHPHQDQLFSLRWDPVEDRRYALMWSDPTSSDNKAKTNWAMNLLAYRGLQLLPCIPGSSKLATTGVSRTEAGFEWSWPIWSGAIAVDTVRSLLALSELQECRPNRNELLARGIQEVFRSLRVQVGNPPLHKLNFSPATTV